MKVYRGPKTAEYIDLTDDVRLKKEMKNLRPDDMIFMDINLDKESGRQSSAAVRMDEEDFELIHNNYIKHLKEKVKALSLEVSKHRQGWEAIRAYMNNLQYFDNKKKEIVHYVNKMAEALDFKQWSEDQYEKVVIEPIEFLEIEEAIDSKGTMSALEVQKHFLEIFKNALEEFEDHASYVIGRSFFIIDFESDFKELVKDKSIIESIYKNKKELKPSVVLKKLLKIMSENEDMVHKC